MEEIEKLIEYAEELSKKSDHWNDLGFKLAAIKDNSLDVQKNTLVSALIYDYVETSEVERRERWGIYAPLIEMADGRVSPQPLTILSDEQLSCLELITRFSKDPILLSRINDLLWIRRYSKRPDIFARNSIKSYLEIVERNWHSIYRTECLTRALEISQEINDSGLIKKISNKVVDFAKENLAGIDLQPGVPLRLIEALDRLPETLQVSEIDVLLDECLIKYESLPEIIDTVYEIKIKRSKTDKEKQSLQKTQIDHWKIEAQKNKGLIHLMNLQKAVELARLYGFSEIVEKILIDIQSIPQEQLKLKEFEVTTTIPNEKIRNYIEWFFKGNKWEDCLIRFGFHGPPSGNYEKNLSETENIIKKYPLQFLISKIVLDENNIPIKFIQNQDEHFQVQLIHQEYQGIMLFGLFAIEILDKFFNSYPNVSIADLTQFFTTTIISKEVAQRLAVAIDFYRKEEYDASVHILLTKIEFIFRVISRELGLAIIRPPIGEKPGIVLPLGSILDSLKGKIDESWRRYFRNLLVDSLGVNIRNRVLHGKTICGSKQETALLIHTICHLRLTEIKKTNYSKKEKD